ncbi:MAG: hypothetical protein Q8903_03175, partial [Bacteroidota bacterium]|nr:hypothetical protein [Bacteroidota bacterium]
MQNEKLLYKEGITVTTELCDDIIKECDEFLKGNEKASFYHHPLWLKILSMESGQPYYCLISRDGSGLINGILPLLKTRGIPFNSFGALSSRRISSLPRTPFAGPLTLSQQVAAEMVEKAIEIQNENPNYLLQLKTDYKIDYPDSGLRTIEWRKSFIKKIPGPEESLKFEDHRADKNILKNVRKAEQANIKFRQAKDIKE